MSDMVTVGRLSPERGTPRTERWRGILAAAAATQSTHWMPTGAGRWHSGQVGRWQRWQRT
ncbi:MAG TPA: hypothetical protein PKC73_01450 [Dermatophilaceae bacterium]|nr:hypothetical protein [Dermatophilaceae bacterium]HMT88276.1 hypothetical protein [Dermatophilaceae bacterium]